MHDAGATTERYARLLAPYQLIRAQTQTITCPMYSGASLSAPSSGTVSIYRPSGAAVVNAAAVSIVSSIASYSVSAASLPATEGLGGRWVVVWSLDFGTAPILEEIRHDAALCRYAIKPTVTDQDIYRRASALDPSGTAPLSTATNYQDKRDLAWGMIVRKLLAAGQRPDLVAELSSLHDAHLVLTLALIFEDFATRLNDAFEATGQRYRAEFLDLWRSLSYNADSDNDGKTDSRRKTSGSMWLGGFPHL